MLEQLLLNTELEESGGDITDGQDLIWLSKDIEIKDKLDSYGYLIDELAAEKKKLAYIKANGVQRVSEATRRVEKLTQKLKSRLNYLSKGEPLKGHLYSFHPFNSKTRTADVEKLSSSETYLTIEIRQDYWNDLITAWNTESPRQGAIPHSIKKRAGKVSELPEDHSAIETVLTPSVRVS